MQKMLENCSHSVFEGISRYCSFKYISTEKSQLWLFIILFFPKYMFLTCKGNLFSYSAQMTNARCMLKFLKLI